MLARILQDTRTERVILGLILFNAVTLGLEAEPAVLAAGWGPLLETLDAAILSVFVLELAARISVQRLRFFRDPWNLFDFVVIGFALVPATGSLSVLRALRVLRVLRLVTVIPSLKRVVNGLITALPGMGSILILLLLVFYVFSVMGAKLYGPTKPELFGGLGAAAYSLFQVMTFDDWSGGIVKPLMETHPLAWLFFIAFMLLSSFMALNLFIGVVVSALDDETGDDVPKLLRDPDADRLIAEELAALRQEIAALRRERDPHSAPSSG
ncbi:ion transporter [Enterovirga sp.]|jgi:voltage-gated sodium channel|uniref:ion transporter n=1 Tax=Enterovirga sp. TaxID=2026350 RepID=UPI0026148A4F|nr:ion transporter [Enterovirga sp.]MDB5590154.1 voltage-gated sodium channel [Enterovirga sp.]